MALGTSGPSASIWGVREAAWGFWPADPLSHGDPHVRLAQKWRRFGAALFAESGCSLARLELQEGSEKARREPRRIIRLRECLRVDEAGADAGSPRDTRAFVLQTRERQYLLAAPCAERGDWVRDVRLLAFPVSGCRAGCGCGCGA